MKSIIGWKGCIWLGVLTAAIGLVQYQPAAAQGITADEFKHSLWDTTYTTASGGRVRATVVLDGASGYYDIPGARGRLSNVQYFIDTAGGGGSSRNWAAKGNYYRECTFPAGGYQLLILFPSKPQWVYWYNPDKQVYWCC